jgi:hypothetical protein
MVESGKEKLSGKTLCDICDYHFNYRVVTWGKPLNETEEKCNRDLEEEGKAEECTLYGCFFNKSFKKKIRSCQELEGLDDE